MGFKGFSFFAVVVTLAIGATVFQNCSKVDEKTENQATGSFKNYYFLENNYSCAMADGTVIRTYKGRIAYDKQQFYVHGDGCSKGAEAFEKSNSSFVVTDTQITYQGNAYVLMSKEPSFP